MSELPARAVRRAAILVCAAAGVADPAASGGIDQLEKLGRALRTQASWSADYHQEYVPVGMTLGDEERGRVWVAWPGNALFESGHPTNRVMGVADRRVRLVDLDVSTCDEHVLDDQEWSRVPLAAVLDPGRAVDHFAVLDHGQRGFALVPRDAGGVARVDVALDSAGLPVEVVIVDPQGSTNRLRFKNWRGEERPPGGGWLPEAPEGVACVGDDELEPDPAGTAQ